jgi:endogenous inhibitor of DNA gyrase (YacG/DUF329 family)
MVQVFGTKCPECEKAIEWCYERSVYEGEIQCPECGTFIEVDDSNRLESQIIANEPANLGNANGAVAGIKK